MSSQKVLEKVLLLLIARDQSLIPLSKFEGAVKELEVNEHFDLGKWLVANCLCNVEHVARLEKLVEQRLTEHGYQLTGALRDLSLEAAIQDLSRFLEKPPVENVALTEAWNAITQLHRGSGDSNQTAIKTVSTGEGRFRIVRQLAKGGLGIVYVAEDRQLRREVALKHIQSQFEGSEVLQQKFLFEAEVTGQLEHPNIVPIYALGSNPQGTPYYAMRLIRGNDLKQAIREYHLERKAGTAEDRCQRDLLRRFIDVCNALDYAHSRGVLHRDLKPGNVMLGKFGETFVVDWGLAKTSTAEKPKADLHAALSEVVTSGSSAEATSQGSFLGTLAYAPPEQLRGLLDQLDVRSDVFALGAILYEILVGKPPAAAARSISDAIAIIENLDYSNADAAAQSGAPKPLMAIARRALSPRKENRYPSVNALKLDVEAWIDDLPVSAFPEGIVQQSARWIRRNRGVVITAFVSMTMITIVSMIGGLAYRAIAQKEREASKTASSQADRAKRANESSQAALRAASIRELQIANALINETYSEVDEELRSSRLGQKSGWHLGVSHLLSAIELNSENHDAKRRLYSTLIHQGRKRRDFPLHIWEHVPNIPPITSRLGHRLVYLSAADRAEIIDLSSDRFTRHDIQEIAHIEEIALSEEGDYLATRTSSCITLWNCRTGELVVRHPCSSSSRFIADGFELQRLYVKDEKNRIRAFHLDGSVTDLKADPNPGPSGTAEAFFHKGKLYEFFIGLSVLKLTDVVSGEVTRRKSEVAWNRDKCILPQSSYIAFCDRFEAVRLMNVDLEDAPTILLSNRPGLRPMAIVASPDGGRIAIGWLDGIIEIFRATDLQQGAFELSARIQAESIYVESLAFSPDGLRLSHISVADVRVWDAISGNPITEVFRHDEKLNQVPFEIKAKTFFSRNGGEVFVCAMGKIYVWLTTNGGDSQICFPHKGTTFDISANAAESVLAIASNDRYVPAYLNEFHYDLWSISDLKRQPGQINNTFQYHPAISFSPDGEKLIVGYEPKTKEVVVYASTDGKPKCSLKSPLPSAVHWLPDSQRICIKTNVAKQEHLALWDAVKGERLWSTEEEYKDATLADLNDSTAVVLHGDENSRAITLIDLSSSPKVYDSYQIPGDDYLEQVQFFPQHECIILWVREYRRSTRGGAFANYRLNKLDVKSGRILPEVIRLNTFGADLRKIRTTSKMNSDLNQALIFEPTSRSIIRVADWNLIKIQKAEDFADPVASMSKDGKFVFLSELSGTRSGLWDAASGEFLGESTINGLGDRTREEGTVAIVNNRRNVTSLLNKTMEYEVEEPVRSLGRTAVRKSTATFLPSADLLLVPNEDFVILREMLPTRLLEDVSVMHPEDADWIRRWIGLKDNGARGYQRMLLSERTLSSSNDTLNVSVWNELQRWLLDQQSTRPVTPGSRWHVSDASHLALQADAKYASEFCLRQNANLRGTRKIIADALIQAVLQDDKVITWRRRLAEHLAKFDNS